MIQKLIFYGVIIFFITAFVWKLLSFVKREDIINLFKEKKDVNQEISELKKQIELKKLKKQLKEVNSNGSKRTAKAGKRKS